MDIIKLFTLKLDNNVQKLLKPALKISEFGWDLASLNPVPSAGMAIQITTCNLY